MSLEKKESLVNVQLEEKYVCFLDVLGFKSFIDDQAKLQEYYNTVCEVLKILKNEDTIEMQIMSDAIVIGFEIGTDNTSNLIEALELVGRLQIALLTTQGVLTRGGFTKGKFFSDPANNIVTGKGLADAYIIESEFAVNPRVVVDPQVFKQLGKELTEWMFKGVLIGPQTQQIDQYSGQYSDAIWINYLKSESVHDWQLAERFLNSALEVIEEGFYGDQAHFSKYSWFRTYIRMAIDKGFWSNEALPEQLDEMLRKTRDKYFPNEF